MEVLHALCHGFTMVKSSDSELPVFHFQSPNFLLNMCSAKIRGLGRRFCCIQVCAVTFIGYGFQLLNLGQGIFSYIVLDILRKLLSQSIGFGLEILPHSLVYSYMQHNVF